MSVPRVPGRQTQAVTLGFASLAHTYSHMFILFFATVVLVLQREWGLGYAELMSLSVPSAILFGAGALPAGWLGDRWSAAGMIAVFFFGIGVCSILTGIADSPLTLALGLAGIGLFGSIYHPVGIPWLIRSVRNPGRALGINGVFGGAGTAAAALIAGALAEFWDWRAAFIVPGLVALATGVLFVLAMARGQIRENPIAANPSSADAADAQTRRRDMMRVFAALAVTVVATGMIYQAMSFALPKLFEERLFDLVSGSFLGIGGLVTVCFLGASLTQLIGGELADRYDRRLVYVVALGLQAPVFIAAFLLHQGWLLAAIVVVLSLNVIGQPAENALLSHYTPERWRGRIFGAKFLLTLGVSSFGVALVPIIHAATGALNFLLVAMAICAAIAFIAGVQLPKARVSVPPAQPAAVPAVGGDD